MFFMWGVFWSVWGFVFYIFCVRVTENGEVGYSTITMRIIGGQSIKIETTGRHIELKANHMWVKCNYPILLSLFVLFVFLYYIDYYYYHHLYFEFIYILFLFHAYVAHISYWQSNCFALSYFFFFFWNWIFIQTKTEQVQSRKHYPISVLWRLSIILRNSVY